MSFVLSMIMVNNEHTYLHLIYLLIDEPLEQATVLRIVLYDPIRF